MNLEQYSIGIGDRFGRQGRAQLQAILKALEKGVEIVPVWNKSHREHKITGTDPSSVRFEADAAVMSTGWTRPYFVDADHIGAANVDLFVAACDFFTLDVADFIGKAIPEEDVHFFLNKHGKSIRSLDCIGGAVTEEAVSGSARKYLGAVKEAGRIYRRIEAAKGATHFITEVSMDETDVPQSPLDLYLILVALADEGIPVATIAPRFSGRFNKGVDYVGDVDRFAQEFEADVRVIARAVSDFGLPSGLKLSIHSGSDKFSIYPVIGRIIRKHHAGLHLKTAGTTWLEEVISLAEVGGDALDMAIEIYGNALSRMDDLCRPYASVIDIKSSKLPSLDIVRGWSGREFASAVRHDPFCSSYNPDMRQLLHVGYKVAAEMGARYIDMLEHCETKVSENVMENIYERHLKRIFET